MSGSNTLRLSDLVHNCLVLGPKTVGHRFGLEQSLIHVFHFCAHAMYGLRLEGADCTNVLDLIFRIGKVMLQSGDVIGLCHATVCRSRGGN